MPDSDSDLSPEDQARLTQIWDQLYALYLAKANGQRAAGDIDADIAALITQRDAIRSWGWSTGRNWREDQKPAAKAK
jgi:hypothetical protein